MNSEKTRLTPVVAAMAMALALPALAQQTEAVPPPTQSEPASAPANVTGQQPAADTPKPYPELIHVNTHEPEAPLPDLEQKDKTKLETVVVTAAYRNQNIQDVTGSAQAFTGRGLDKDGANGMHDYLLQVPSVSLKKSGNGKVDLSMRGISNGNASDLGYAGGNPTVGVYLDDVAIQGSGVFPDLNIYDLRRVEVLKGPQGTLYGEGSMGGAIKMVTMPADPNKWSARAQTMISDTESGDLNHEARGALNIPIWHDTLGARVVGSMRKNAGFVDYTNLNRPDADVEHMASFRGVLGFQPWEPLKLEYMYLYDFDHRDQFPVVDEGKQQELTNSRKEPQFALTRFGIHSLTARLQLPFANLTSVSAFYNTYRDSVRRTPVLQSLIDTQLQGTGITAPEIFSVAYTRVKNNLHSFSQELRLVSFGGEPLDWIGGLFFRTRGQTFDEQKYEDSIPTDPTGVLQQILDLVHLGNFNLLQGKQEDGFGEERFKQYAGYGEVTWNIIPSTLQVTGGLRAFSEDVSFFINTQFYGVEAALIATDPSNIDPNTGAVSIYFAQSVKTRGLLPKLTASWHLNGDHMLYATLVRGFRSGAANVYAALQSGPPVIRPDYVWNQEIGAKSTWLNGTLVTNLAAYRINWHDVQGTVVGTAKLGQATVSFAHLDNAGDAMVLGAEASVTWMPVERLMLLLNAGYNRGQVTDPTPASHVPEGSPIPNSPRFTGAATIGYGTPIAFGVNGEVSTTYTYTGKQDMTFQVESFDNSPVGSGLRHTSAVDGFPVPGYGLLKGSIGFSRGKARLQFFGDNMLDNRAIISISAPTPQYAVTTPRTIGVRVSYDF